MRATQEEGKFSSWEVIIRIADMFTCPAELQVPVVLGNHWGHAGGSSVLAFCGSTEWPRESHFSFLGHQVPFPSGDPWLYVGRILWWWYPHVRSPFLERKTYIYIYEWQGWGGGQDFRRQRDDKIGQRIQMCFCTLCFPASHCSCRAKMTELTLWARNAFDISCFTPHKTRRG